MADTREPVREMARRVGLQVLGDELERRIRSEGCPAAAFIGAVRADGMPGCRCRVEHSTLSLGGDPSTILRWCSKGPTSDMRRNEAGEPLNGYVNCPTWEFEKLRLMLGMHSLGDEDRLEELEARTWREDVTGSPYGDLSAFEEVGRAVSDTMEAWTEQYWEGLGQ
jgi:hypothetical protein